MRQKGNNYLKGAGTDSELNLLKTEVRLLSPGYVARGRVPHSLRQIVTVWLAVRISNHHYFFVCSDYMV